MKESYECEVASHIGPESCGAAREGGVEALTRERPMKPTSLSSFQTFEWTLPRRRLYTLPASTKSRFSQGLITKGNRDASDCQSVR